MATLNLCEKPFAINSTIDDVEIAKKIRKSAFGEVLLYFIEKGI